MLWHSSRSTPSRSRTSTSDSLAVPSPSAILSRAMGRFTRTGAFTDRPKFLEALKGKLAKLQERLGSDCLTVNIDGTQAIQVKPAEMLEFLPKLVPALQEATKLPLAFDNPSAAFHRKALSLYDRSRGPAPVLNSLAASREHLDEMISLVKEFDTRVIVMASERFTSDGGAPCRNAQEVHQLAPADIAVADRLEQLLVFLIAAELHTLLSLGTRRWVRRLVICRGSNGGPHIRRSAAAKSSARSSPCPAR